MSCLVLAAVAALVTTSISFTGCAKSATGPSGDDAKLEVQVLGAAAPALLKADPYSKLVVEVASVSGREPAPGTLSALATFLEARLLKPGGIEFVAGDPIPSNGNDAVNQNALGMVESQYRKKFSGGDTVAIYVMFLDGHYDGDTAANKVMGLAYRATSLVIFKDTLRSQALPTDWSLVEKTVLAHEMGHIMGLVNIGTTMTVDHYDADHGAGHCSNPNCLMNYALNSSAFLHQLGTDVPLLDEKCLADLRAAGGK
jgi:hypothetical protein